MHSGCCRAHACGSAHNTAPQFKYLLLRRLNRLLGPPSLLLLLLLALRRHLGRGAALALLLLVLLLLGLWRSDRELGRWDLVLGLLALQQHTGRYQCLPATAHKQNANHIASKPGTG